MSKEEDKEGWGIQALKAVVLLSLLLGVALFFTWGFNLVLNPDYSELNGLYFDNKRLELENKDLHELLDNHFPFNLIYFFDGPIRIGLLLFVLIWFIREVDKPYFIKAIKKVKS